MKNDDTGVVQAILQRVAPEALADLGDGRTWVRAAFTSSERESPFLQVGDESEGCF